MTHEEEFCEAIEQLIERYIDLRFAEKDGGADGYYRSAVPERKKLVEAQDNLLRVVKNGAEKDG
jgi:hypothetical protein